jgi:hypothetical protein
MLILLFTESYYILHKMQPSHTRLQNSATLHYIELSQTDIAYRLRAIIDSPKLFLANEIEGWLEYRKNLKKELQEIWWLQVVINHRLLATFEGPAKLSLNQAISF